MLTSAVGPLAPMVYHWGLLEGRNWQRRGEVVITADGVLLDDERLPNPTYHRGSQSLAFGGPHGSSSRNGRFVFDTTQLSFHGVMELDDGAPAHVIGFAQFDVTYETTTRPIDEPDATTAKGPDLRIQTDTTASDHPVDGPATRFSLIVDGVATDVTDRVFSHCLNPALHTFKITMGANPDGFPPSRDCFDVTMVTDMSGFEGTLKLGPAADQKLSWTGRPRRETIEPLLRALAEAPERLAKAPLRPIANVASAALLAELAASPGAGDRLKDGETARLPGLDAEDYAFLVRMEKEKGLKVGLLEDIRAIEVHHDEKGKSVVVDHAQCYTNSAMNTGMLQSLDEPWKGRLAFKLPTLDCGEQRVVDDNCQFFKESSVLQTGSVLKYKQDAFKDRDLEAIKRINECKLKKKWKAWTTEPERLKRYMKASTAMYGYAYSRVRSEFSAYTDSEKEQWARAYYHWLTDPKVMPGWQNPLSGLDPDSVTAWIYDWHAKLSILAPYKPYAAKMQAYALGSLIQAQAGKARFVDDATPILAEAIASGAQADPTTVSATGQDVSDPAAPIIKQRLADLTARVDAETVATAVAAAAKDWQEQNPGAGYVAHLYFDAGAIAEIARHLDPAGAAAFETWAADTEGDAAATAGQILSTCVRMAVTAFLLAGLAPKNGSTAGSQYVSASGIEISPKVKWVLVGLKIGQLVINGTLPVVSSIAARSVASLWTQYLPDAGEAPAELSEALAQIEEAMGEEAEVPGWLAALGARLGKFLKVLGPVLALVGLGLSLFNFISDLLAGRGADAIIDSIGVLGGIVGAGVGLASLFGLMTASVAGPIGIVVAIVGVFVLVFKLLWDALDPPPTPIMSFVSGPLTDLGVVDPKRDQSTAGRPETCLNS